MAHTIWKTTQKSIGIMFLDPNNPRIPPMPKPLTEPELIVELVLHDDVHQLASNIQANGYFPTEPLMIVRENGKFRVAEGNRRLAACKLLVNPDLAPESYKTKFRHLSTSVDARQFSRIPVVIAPNRESTIPIIIARHTSSQIQKWEPAMQASFYQKLVSSGLSIEEVAKKFNLPASRVKEALHSYNLYQMACRLDLDDKTAEVVRDPRAFKLTTLSRIFETPVGRSVLGVELSDDGKIVGKIPQDEFAKGFRRLVKDVVSGDADSRKLNSPADIKDYLDKFAAAEKPDLSKKGSFDSDSFLTTTASTATPASKKPKKKQTHAGIGRGLIPTQFSSNIKNTRVQEVLSELKLLRVDRFPNSVALSFRCFIELSVYCFLNAKGEIRKMEVEKKAEIKLKNAKLKPGKPPHILPPHWSPSLSEMLSRLIDPAHNLISDPQVTKAMKKTIKDEEELFALNLYTHNPSYHPTEPRLRSSWKNFEDFLKLVHA